MGTTKIFAFDIGTGSLGECVRTGKEINHLQSLTMPSELAEIKTAAGRRRMLRTRQAHLARENWWRETAKKAGLEVLGSAQPIHPGKHSVTAGNTPADKRLLTEFSPQGDETIYTSCLLRIALLQGRKLESWQVYKAIRSAMQHRGYDRHIAWAERDNKRGEIAKAVSKYETVLKELTQGKEEFLYPCYYEAARMGLWSPTAPEHLKSRLDGNPDPARNKGDANTLIAPRELVEKELRDLLKQAAKQYPKLQGREETLIYGPAGIAYASYKKPGEFGQYRGHDWEWQGLLSQKVPRFDNRIINKCALVPRLNVCKSADPLNMRVTFMMKLKNMRYFDAMGEQKILTPEQIKELLSEFAGKLEITEAGWRKWLKKNFGNAMADPAQPEVEAPKAGGRSRFCRPVLKLLESTILSGKSPHKVYEESVAACSNTDPARGLTRDDYKFLLAMPAEWAKFHIPDAREEDAALSAQGRTNRIEALINEVSNAVVRHRLHLFHKRLQALSAKHGEPDQVVIELVREDFLGEEAKKDFNDWQKRNRKEKLNAREEARRAGAMSASAIVKVRLLKEQGFIDLYSGKKTSSKDEPGGVNSEGYIFTPLMTSKVEDYQIDHIVPRSIGGPDDMRNKVVTTATNNLAKANMTPYQWLSKDKDLWKAYTALVASKSNKGAKQPGLSKKKSALLTSANAKELIDNYKNLAGTAYTAKLASKITALFFGWPEGTEGSAKRVRVYGGGETHSLRARLHLDSILHQGLKQEELAELAFTGELDKKNRDNPRHHALDALTLSILPEQGIPEWFNAPFCKTHMEKVNPLPIALKKPVLAETMYALRKVKKDGKDCYIAITRFGTGTSVADYISLADAKKYAEAIFDPVIRQALLNKLDTEPQQQDWEKFIKEYFAARKLRKIALICSAPMTQEEVDLKTGIAGEYRAMGKIDPVQGKTHKTQWFKDKKEHQGQILYRSAKGRWKVEPVYLYQSLTKAIKAAQAAYGKENVRFFRSGQLVQVNNDCNKDSKTNAVEAGYYYLRTIKSSGQTKLETVDGSKTQGASIGELIETGDMVTVKNT